MLTDTEITETESVFLALDSGDLTDEIIFKLREYIYNKYFEQHCYLDWLLDRWTILRKHRHQLPKRTIKNLMDRREVYAYVPDKKKKTFQFKPGDWRCIKCTDHQFAKNTVCRVCGSTKITFMS